MPRQVQHLGHLADRLTVEGDDVDPDQLVVVVLVLVVRSLLRVDVGQQQGVVQALGRRPVVDPGEVQQQPAAVHPTLDDGQRADASRIGEHDRAGTQAGLRLVGADLDRRRRP